MANKKITDLSTLTSGSLSSVDIILIVDRSYSETKTVTLKELLGYLQNNLTTKESYHSLSSETAELATVATNSITSSISSNSNNSVSSSLATLATSANSGGTSDNPFYVKSFTDQQISLIEPANGMIIYNTTVSKLQVYITSEWRNVTTTSL